MFDSAAQTKAEMNAAAFKWRADKEFESIGRVKAEADYEEIKYAKQMLREEIEEGDQADIDAGDLDNSFFFIKAVRELRAEDTARVYDTSRCCGDETSSCPRRPATR